MVDLIIAAVLIIILAVSAFIGMKKGFIRMIAGFTEYIVSFLIAYIFSPKLAVYVKKLPFIAKMISDVEMPVFADGAGFGDKIKSVISFIVDNAIVGGKDATAETKAICSNYFADIIAVSISFVALFIVLMLVQKLIVWLLDLIAKAPVLKQTNGVLGLLFGLFCGSFWTWILSNVFVRGVLPILTAKYPATFPESIAETAIMKFFIGINPVSLFLNALTWLADKLG